MRLEGRQIGRYYFERLIGTGGMGQVYLAVDPRIQQQVAIKVMQVEDSSFSSRNTEKEVAHFRREANAIARLNHPHIIRLNDYDEAEVDGTKFTYIVTPFYQEGSLANWLRQRTSGPLSLQDIAHFVRQAADALQYAHTHQIIHQDVKPSNFLIDTEENANWPDLLLTDFGISKSSSTTAYTGTQASQGTLTYMAPEQINGQPTYASDQYALAVMTYELLTGRPPFQGPPQFVIRQHFETQPQPPGSLNPSLPRSIDNVILRALAKKPEDRFDSVAAFANAFQQGLPRGKKEPIMNAVLNGPFGRTTLGPTPLTIGRAPDNQLVLNNPETSSHHAEIRPEGQGYSIVDLGSTNGTFLNGQPLERNVPRMLNPGDSIRIGDLTFTYEASQPPGIAPTVYAPPSQGDAPGYLPTVAAPPPTAYGNVNAPQSYQQPPPSPSYPDAAQSPVAPPPPPQSPPSSPTGPVSMSGFSGSIPVLPPVPVPWWKRRLVWAALSIFLLVLLVAGGVFAYENSLPTPAKTLKTYCDAIPTGDSITAYNQLSPNFQKRAPQQMMRDFFSGVTSCTYDSVNLASSRATAHLSLVTPKNTSDDQVTMMYSDANGWKIDDETNLSNFVNQSEVKQTLNTYCTDLQHGDYAGVYGQFSDALQKKITQELFASFYPTVTDCTSSSPTVSGTSATTTVSLTSGGQTESDPLQLVQNAGTGWKIDNIQNLSTPTKTLQAFCNGIASHTDQGYQSAYDQISDGYKQQNNFTLDQFKARFGNFNGHGAITACQVHNVSTNGPSAGLGQIDVVTEDKSSGIFGYTLDVEQGIWKITQQY